MKKILGAILVINTIFIVVSGFWLFSYDAQIRILENKTEISVEKPDNISNAGFISTVKRTAQNLNADIAYINFDLSGDKYIENIYTTRNDENFLNLDLEVENYKKDLYSTTNKAEQKIYTSNFMIDYHIEQFDAIELLSLNNNSYYIDSDKTMQWKTELEKEGFIVNIVANEVDAEYTYLARTNKIFAVSGILVICLILSVFFYFSSEIKEIEIEVINGNGFINIFIQELI